MLLIRLIERACSRLSHEEGFTMLLAIAALLITSLLVTAALVAAQGDIHLTKRDTSSKKAYYAAQAGIDNYLFHLNRNSSYWAECTEGAAATNNALNQKGSTKNRVSVPGATEEEYAIQLLPASTSPETKCNPAKPTETMIEEGTEAGGTFRIESTGYSGKTSTCEANLQPCAKRTLVASFANSGLLNFIYYTKYETLDPNTYSPPKPQCEAFRTSRPSECENITFGSKDDIKGPLHTEDTSQYCGEPTFGRDAQDQIEFKGGLVKASGCSASESPVYEGTKVTKVETVEPPTSNASLKSLAGAKYTGKTTIVLNGATMTVTNNGTTQSNIAVPSNGVIYVSSESCSISYTPYNPTYTADTGCGNAYVSGNYTKSLTIAAENDVVIDGAITTTTNAEGVPTSGAVLGLIANNFVRVWRPLNASRGSTKASCGTATAPSNPTNVDNISIYAAILALNHSFIVDNNDCGGTSGNLNVYGAIAQKFRGTVGTGNTSTGELATGYNKEYEYDDRLQIESPPYFLNPVKAAWKIRRETLAPSP
jgi:type II secretory pathway pseudopilin PulG